MLVNRRITKRISAMLFALALAVTELNTAGVTVYASQAPGGEAADEHLAENVTEAVTEAVEEGEKSDDKPDMLGEELSEGEAEVNEPEDITGDVISEDEMPEAASGSYTEEPEGASIDLKLGGVQLPSSTYPNIYVKKDTTNGVVYVAIESLEETGPLVCNGDLVLIIKGDNRIKESTTSYINNGIEVQGTLTIVSESTGGKLRVDAGTGEKRSAGIHAQNLIMTGTTKNYSGLKNNAGTQKDYSNCSSTNVEVEAHGGKVTGWDQTPSEGSYGILLDNNDPDREENSIMAGTIKAWGGLADSQSVGIKMDETVIGGTANVETSYGSIVNGTVRDGYGIGAGISIGEIRGTNQGGNATSCTLTIKDSATVKTKGAPVYRGSANGASRSYGLVGYGLNMQGGTLEAEGSTVGLKNANSEVGSGESFGIWCRNYNQIGGTITAKSGTADTGYAKYASSCGLYVYGSAQMSAGTLNATAGDAWNLSSGVFVYSDATLSNTASVTAKGGLAVCDQNQTSMGSYGMYVGSKLWAAGASKIDATAGRMIWRLQHPEDAGIYARYLTVAGNASLIGRGGEAKYEKGSFSSSDNPSAMWPDDTHGIEVLADLSMQGGTLTGVGGNVTTYSQTMSKDEAADSYGIYVKGTASFSGGTVNGTGGTTSYSHSGYGEDSYGIYTESVPSMTGATVTAIGGSVGTKDTSGTKCVSYGLYYKTNSTLNCKSGRLMAKGYTGAVRTNGTIACYTPILKGSSDYSGSNYVLQNSYNNAWKYALLSADDAIVNISNWTYGDTPGTPSVYNLNKYGNGDVTVTGYNYWVKIIVSGRTYYSALSAKPTEAGEFRVRATLSNGVTGSYTYFKILPRNLSSATINFGTQNVYNGSSQAVVISSVKYGSTTLTKDTDYTITGGGTATNVGNTTLTITGKGNYTGTKTGTWSLQKAELKWNDFSNITKPDDRQYRYDGTYKSVSTPVKSGVGKVTVWYHPGDNLGTNELMVKEPGDYYITFDVEEGKNYKAATNLRYGNLETGTSTKSDIRMIIRKITGEPVDCVETARVKVGNTVDLMDNIPGVLGTPSFYLDSDNTLTGCSVDSATGLFTAGNTTGICKVKVQTTPTTYYTGWNSADRAKTITVTVDNKESAALTVNQGDITYGENPDPTYTPNISSPTIKYSGVRYDGMPYSKPTEKPTEAGSYVVTVTGESGIYSYSGSKSFKIKPKSIEGAVITLGTQDTYDGTSKNVEISSVKLGGKTFAPSDYEILSGGTAVDVNEQSVVIQGKGNYTGTATSTAKWKLQKRTPVAGDFSSMGNIYKSYTGEAITPVDIPKLKNGMTGCGDITVYYRGWSEMYRSETPPADVNDYYVTFDVADGTNFNAATELSYATLQIMSVDFNGDKEIASGGQVGRETALDLANFTNGGRLDSVSVTSGSEYLATTPTVNGKTLKYTFKSGTAVGSTAVLSVLVVNCKNYNNYYLTVTLTAEHDHTLQHVDAREPDCTLNGNHEYWICTIDGCGKLFKDVAGTRPAFEEDLIIPALGHDWGEWVVVKEPTATETGLKERECKRCHEKQTEEIPVTGEYVEPGSDKEWTVEFDETTITKDASGEYALTYTGSALKPGVIVKHGRRLLIEGVDYKLKYQNNVNYSETGAGIAVSGKGQYKGMKTLKFMIARKNIADTDISVGNTLVEKDKEANPTLVYNGVLLTNWKDYTLTKDQGSVKVQGQGNYSGDRTIAVTELEKNEFKKRSVRVTMQKVNRIYNGREQTLGEEELSVKDADGNLLKSGTDYIVSYSSNVNVGTVKVIVMGVGTHCGTAKKSFKIQPAKNASFKVSTDKDSYTYVKSGVKPTLSVNAVLQGSSEAVTLKEGKDYKVSYSANKKPGKGKFKLTFLGNYKGAKYKDDCSFNITADKITGDDKTLVLAGNMLYKKPGKYRAKTYVIVNGSLLANGDYTLKYSDADRVTLEDGKSLSCNVTVRAKEKANAKYTDGTGGVGVTASYSVMASSDKTDVSKAKVSLVLDGKAVKSVPYTGSPITFKAGAADTPQLSLAVKGGATLSAADIEKDFDIYYADNVEKGKATVIFVPKSASPYTGICVGTFKITNGIFGGK